MPVEDSYTRHTVPKDVLAMTGPSIEVEPGRLPVRGDLAHVKLAGRYFVPHYAAPMPWTIGAKGAVLRSAPDAQAEAICPLASGEVFNVLDIAGNWAWGQHGEDGFVGYVALPELDANAA